MLRSMASLSLSLGIAWAGAAFGSSLILAADGKWPSVAKVESQPLIEKPY